MRLLKHSLSNVAAQIGFRLFFNEESTSVQSPDPHPNSRMLSSGIELRGMAFACVAGESGVVVVEIDLQECSV